MLVKTAGGDTADQHAHARRGPPARAGQGARALFGLRARHIVRLRLQEWDDGMLAVTVDEADSGLRPGRRRRIGAGRGRDTSRCSPPAAGTTGQHLLRY